MRRGVLIALCAVGRALLPSILVADFDEMLPELQEWLREKAAADTDDGVQQLAVAAHAIYAKAVQGELRSAAEDEL